MCDLCNENRPVGCQDCGILVCFDVKNGDDVIRPAYITESGDLFCDRCGKAYDQAEEEEYENADYYYPGPWDD